MGFLSKIFTFKRKELPFIGSMGLQFFLIITIFWILKPLKKTLFISFYDKLEPGTLILDFIRLDFNAAELELLAKILNLGVALVALAAFSWLSKRFKREKLAYIFASFFAICFLGLALFLKPGSETLVWGFYLYGDLFSTAMVTTFFAYLLDSVSSSTSRRIFGPIVLGGVLGGVFGTNWVRVWINDFALNDWMWICLGLTGLILAATWYSSINMDQDELAEISASKKSDDEPRKFNIVSFLKELKSDKYLLAIISILGIYEMVSTMMDFQFSSVVAYYLDGKAIGQHFATVYSLVSWMSFIVQLFVTSFILTRFGVKSGLTVLPACLLVTSLSFIVFPFLWIASLLPIFDNGLNYSINQTSREALYVPLNDEKRYQAKAFIDIFVMRGAKVLAILLSLWISSVFSEFKTLKWLSFVIVIFVGLWLIAVNYAGRKYQKLTTVE